MNFQIEIIPLSTLLALPEPEWLIEGHIHQQEMGVMYGPPNMGKSFVAIDWALSVANGIPWLGRYATTQTPVLYMAGEGGSSLQKRADAWQAKHNRTLSPIYFQCRPIPVLNDDAIAELQEALDAFVLSDDHEPGINPGFIVVDTLSQFMCGGDENGSDMAAFVANLRSLSQERNATILIVHHTNKGGIQERGHTALRSNVDVMFSIVGHEKHHQLAEIEIQNDKQRDDKKALPERIAVEVLRQSLVLSLANPSKFPANLVEISNESLVNLLIVAGNVEESSHEIFQSEEWRIVSTLSPSSYARDRSKLMKLKLVKEAGHGKYKFTPLGRNTMYYYRKIRGK